MGFSVKPTVAEPDPLEARFSGKRKADRYECQTPVVLHSGRRKFQGEAINISRSGVLVRLPYAALARSVGGLRVGSAMDAADRHFGTGFRLEFLGTTIDRAVVLVRMAMEVSEPDSLRLGCEFRGEITNDEVDLISRITRPTRA
jgi:hypothetical protein